MLFFACSWIKGTTMVPKTKKDFNLAAEILNSLAERTGLEPATSGVTGRHSNQLNYHSITLIKQKIEWWAVQGSNL